MKKWLVVIVLASAQFVMVLDSTVMNVSISTVVKDLNTSVTAMQTAITFYTLTMAALMLIGAKLCSKWGLLRAFTIGSVVYGIGSLITALSPNIATLFLGWSIIEGLGAVLVIPAIAALIAVTYKGKDRVTAFAIIGGVSGMAAAAGPLIGGFMTTYLSWRYVFLIETVVMVIVLIAARSFQAGPKAKKLSIDTPSAILSAVGLTMMVYGMLQAKVWGLVQPIAKPEIAGHQIAPLGISLVAYLILGGLIILKLFYDRQVKLETAKQNPLLRVSLLKISALRSGLSVLGAQYAITAGVFFIVPIYLQMVIGLDALQTGMKIFPLSVALILASLVGSQLVKKFSPRRIIRIGQVLLLLGSISLMAAVDPELTGAAFAMAMFSVGAGLGLLASQIGNVTMSAVDLESSNEVGGMSGTFQNLGSSLGTAVIGSVLVVSLTSGFITRIDQSSLPTDIKNTIAAKAKTGVAIVPASEVTSIATSKGLSAQEASDVTTIYEESQLAGLKESIFFLIAIATLSILLSRNIPNKKVA